ncbi:MAG: hypothetical protein MI919_03705, partial [Holophagales bacterium]|nr:hypothetical protein [Holophagales bacterium]
GAAVAAQEGRQEQQEPEQREEWERAGPGIQLGGGMARDGGGGYARGHFGSGLGWRQLAPSGLFEERGAWRGLGTWQGIFLWEHRYYRGHRQVLVHLS